MAEEVVAAAPAAATATFFWAVTVEAAAAAITEEVAAMVSQPQATNPLEPALAADSSAVALEVVLAHRVPAVLEVD